MNEYRLAEALGGVSDGLVQEAVEVKKKNPWGRRLLRIAAAAAAVAILVTAAIGLWPREDGIITKPGLLTITAYAADGTPFAVSSPNTVVPFSHYWAGVVSWVPGCPITLSVSNEMYASDDITFDVSVDGGGYYIGEKESTGQMSGFYAVLPEKFDVPNNSTIYWSTTYDPEDPLGPMFTDEISYTKLIIFDGEYIVGYAIFCFRNITWAEVSKNLSSEEKEKWEQQYGFQEDQLTNSFRLEILDSVMFPMVDGEYQQITEEYVHQCIEKKIGE